MTRQEIKNRVLECIDEINVSGVNDIVNYPIDSLLDESAQFILKIAPIYTIDNVVDFSNMQQTKNSDGTGKVLLPDNFIRLVSFKMTQWSREVTIPYDKTSIMYKKQSNIFTRGGVSKPVVILDSDNLYYFSVDKNDLHKIDYAKAITYIEPDVTFPRLLLSPLIWLTASKVLSVVNEPQAAVDAKNQFQELLNSL